MQKIFFANRCLILSESVEEAMTFGTLSAIHKYSTLNELRQFVDKFRTNDALSLGCVYFHDFTTLVAQFSSLFRPITAAGGLVCNGEGKYLVINRLGVPDFPKGKAEKGETVEQTALREVEEETGLHGLTLGAPLLRTYHTYPLGNDIVLKTTHWFRMTVPGCPDLIPQTEENISSAQWVTSSELLAMQSKSYASIRELLHAAF